MTHHRSGGGAASERAKAKKFSEIDPPAVNRLTYNVLSHQKLKYSTTMCSLCIGWSMMGKGPPLLEYCTLYTSSAILTRPRPGSFSARR